MAAARVNRRSREEDQDLLVPNIHEDDDGAGGICNVNGRPLKLTEEDSNS